MPTSFFSGCRHAVLLLGLAHAPAQQFASVAAPPAASYFEPADMDGDGRFDVIAARAAGIYLHRNDGTNRLGPGVLISNIVSSCVGTTGDFSGDGRRDLVAFAQSTAGAALRVHLLRNLSIGYTTSVVFVPTVFPQAARFLRALDLENDGDLDLVGGAQIAGGATNYFVLANNGTGAFSDVTATWLPSLPTPNSNYEVQILDVNGDGRVDLLLASFLRLLVNTGTTFVDESVQRLPPFFNFCSFAGQGDYDGDGDADLLVNGSPNALLWRNTGGVFVDVSATQLAPGAHPAATGAFFDADDDNDVDLLLARFGTAAPSELLLNNGTGGLLTRLPAPRFGPELQLVQPPLTSGSRGITVADLENDGDQDLVLAWNGLGVLRHAGGARLVDPLAAFRVPGSVAVPMDIDNDADVDLLLVGQYAENDGFGGFTLRPFPGTVPNVQDGMAIGDIDGDGDLDIAADGLLYRNQGGANFTSSPLPSIGIGVHRWGDFDGDGDLDLAVADNSNQSLQVLANSGVGTFTLQQSLPVPGFGLYSLDVGDYEGDGDLDLLLAGASGFFGGVQVIENLGAAGFAPGPSLGSVPPSVAQFAALTGTGSLDIVLDRHALSSPGPVAVFRRTGGVFVDVTSATVTSAFTSPGTAIGDVDGDGDIDLCGRQLARNLGNGTFSLEALGPALPANDSPLRLADFDRDGDLDLLRRTRYPLPAGGFSYWIHTAWNHEHQIDVPLPGKTGRVLVVEATTLPGRASTQELVFVGVSLQRLGLGLPTPFGELRLGPIVTTWLTPIAPVVGTASIAVAIPANPAFVGIDLHFQAMHFGPSGFRLGNVASTTVE